MSRESLILALLISIIVGYSAPQVFAQKTSKIGKKGKMIELPQKTPKKLFVEVTVNGSGNYKCDIPIATCTWKIDRKYSATIDLNVYMKEPFQPMNFEPGTASEIAAAKIKAELKKLGPAGAFNTKWFTMFINPETGPLDVDVSINDETKEVWMKKDKSGKQEEMSKVETWTANTKGRRLAGAEVILNRQRGAFNFAVSLTSTAVMLHRLIASWEELNPLPIELPVFDVPRVKGRLEDEVIIPFGGNVPDEKNATFEEKFTNLKADWLGLGIPETKAAMISVTYKFK